jgi:hypothetical protein
VGIGDIQRGMALGAQSQKEVAMIAQQQYRLTQQAIDSKIVGLTQLINSQNKTLELTQNQAKFMHEIGNKDEFTRLLEKYNDLSAKIEFNQDELRELRSSVDSAAIPAEVSAFLTRSRKAMNMEEGTGETGENNNASTEFM